MLTSIGVVVIKDYHIAHGLLRADYRSRCFTIPFGTSFFRFRWVVVLRAMLWTCIHLWAKSLVERSFKEAFVMTPLFEKDHTKAFKTIINKFLGSLVYSLVREDPEMNQSPLLPTQGTHPVSRNTYSLKTIKQKG